MKNYNFVDDVDYSAIDDASVWGDGDPDTLNVMATRSFGGKWLNLAAGDGRYNTLLLSKADQVTATDIDPHALDRLKEITPKKLLHKLKTETLSLVKPFPFENASFDGVFSTGTLHLFDEKMLNFIFNEIFRVLKPEGTLFMDFATDVKRMGAHGHIKASPDEPSYSLIDGEKILHQKLSGYTLEIIRSSVLPEKVDTGKETYIFSCNFLLVIGKKKM